MKVAPVVAAPPRSRAARARPIAATPRIAKAPLTAKVKAHVAPAARAVTNPLAFLPAPRRASPAPNASP